MPPLKEISVAQHRNQCGRISAVMETWQRHQSSASEVEFEAKITDHCELKVKIKQSSASTQKLRHICCKVAECVE